MSSNDSKVVFVQVFWTMKICLHWFVSVFASLLLCLFVCLFACLFVACLFVAFADPGVVIFAVCGLTVFWVQ